MKGENEDYRSICCADASSLPSGENATAVTGLECPMRLPREAPVFGSQRRTVLPLNADARSLPPDENANTLNSAEWPSRTNNEALQFSGTVGGLLIQSETQHQNQSLIVLLFGLNTRAELHIWSGAVSIIALKYRTKRTAS
jgi:hypothetical protein